MKQAFAIISVLNEIRSTAPEQVKLRKEEAVTAKLETINTAIAESKKVYEVQRAERVKAAEVKDTEVKVESAEVTPVKGK